MSISEIIAERALTSYAEPLPDEVVHLGKRVILDSLACMYGGLGSEVATSVYGGLADIDPSSGASLLGSQTRSGVGGATLYNGALLRFLDLNDIQNSLVSPPGPRHGHNSEVFPSALAAAEVFNRSGDELLRAMSIGIDVATGFTDGILGRSLEERDWNLDSRAGLCVPPMLGVLMGLNAKQITSAIGVSFTRSSLLEIIDSGHEENTTAKNLRFPLTAYGAVVSTFLAKAGVTGPRNVLEGASGFIQVILEGEYDPLKLTDEFKFHRLREISLKAYAACYATHGHIAATIGLANEIDLQPEDVVSVRIRTTTRGKGHTGTDFRRKPPVNKETADHSSFYLTAVAIADRQVGAPQYTTERFNDPAILRLMDLTTSEGAEEFNANYPAAEVIIETKDGKTHAKTVLQPPGNFRNPMTDAEIGTKFHSLADSVIGAAKADEVIEAVWRLDQMANVSEFTTILRG